MSWTNRWIPANISAKPETGLIRDRKQEGICWCLTPSTGHIMIIKTTLQVLLTQERETDGVVCKQISYNV